MTNKTIDHPRMTVQQGRQWLQLQNETADQNVPVPSEPAQVAAVSIPFFEDLSENLNQQIPEADSAVEQVGGADENSMSPHAGTLVEPEREATPDRERLLETVRSDVVEDPGDWMDVPDPPSDPRKSTTEATLELDLAISNLVDLVLERFPLATPASLLFVGSENNPHTDETCTLVAHALAQRNIGKVLLIDSNLTGRLTADSQLSAAPGVSQIVSEDWDWSELIISEPASGLDFMPSGGRGFRRWDEAGKLRDATALMKQRYQFVCVSAGDAHNEVAQAWSGICDGSYLLVSLKNSNGDIAQSAVAELQTCGARLLGCVVTDST